LASLNPVHRNDERGRGDEKSKRRRDKYQVEHKYSLVLESARAS
jgi:hypothetical protein